MISVYIVLGVLIAGIIFVGIMGSRGNNSLDSFIVADRKAGAWATAFGYGTTYFSAVLFIGYAGGSGWAYGPYAILIGVGNAIIGSMLAWIILANRTRLVTRNLGLKSMPQLLATRYHSKKFIKLFSVLVIFIFLLPYSASIFNGLGYFVETVLNIKYIYIMIAITGLAGFYIVLGGYKSALIADLVLGAIMLVGIIALIIALCVHPNVNGLFEGLKNSYELVKPELSAKGGGVVAAQLIGLIFLTSVGAWGMPQMVHRYYGIKSKKNVFHAISITTVFALIVAGGAYLAGSFTRLFSDTNLGSADRTMSNMLEIALKNSVWGELVLGLVLALVVAASVTTLANVSLSASSTVTMDFVGGVLEKKQEPKKALNLTRIICALFVIASLGIATIVYYNNNTTIIDLMSFSWGTISGTFLAPYMLGLYIKRINKKGAITGMLSGFSFSVVFLILYLFRNAWNITLFATYTTSLVSMSAILFSFIMTLIVSFCTKPDDNSTFFENMKEPGAVVNSEKTLKVSKKKSEK